MAQAPAGGRAWRGVMRRWFRRARWRKRRLRAVIGEGFLGLQGLRVPQLNPIGIWISSVIGNRLIPARDFFLEKKQKRARCSGLPSRFILCRTCRAKAACLGGVSVCIPYAAGAACSLSAVRHARTRLWPCACAQGAALRGAVMRSGQQMQWLEGVWWRKRRPACEDGGRYAAVVSAGVVAQAPSMLCVQRALLSGIIPKLL